MQWGFAANQSELVTAQAWSLDLAETLSPTLGEPATQQRAEMILVAGGRMHPIAYLALDGYVRHQPLHGFRVDAG